MVIISRVPPTCKKNKWLGRVELLWNIARCLRSLATKIKRQPSPPLQYKYSKKLNLSALPSNDEYDARLTVLKLYQWLDA